MARSPSDSWTWRIAGALGRPVAFSARAFAAAPVDPPLEPAGAARVGPVPVVVEDVNVPVAAAPAVLPPNEAAVAAASVDELKVNNTRAFRLEPNAVGAPNIVGGTPINLVAEGVVGATISGGGSARGMSSNSVSSDFATIDGGAGNAIIDLEIASSRFATIGGGQDNSINGASRSVIAGGRLNLILSPQSDSYPYTNINSDSTISGGWSNVVEAPFSSIGGGVQNLIAIGTGRNAVRITNGTISGGISNTICGNHSTIGGGRFNTIRVTGGVPYEFLKNGDCTIGGGSFNRLKDYPPRHPSPSSKLNAIPLQIRECGVLSWHITILTTSWKMSAPRSRWWIRMASNCKPDGAVASDYSASQFFSSAGCLFPA